MPRYGRRCARTPPSTPAATARRHAQLRPAARRHGISRECQPGFLRHAYVHAGAGAAPSRGAPTHRVAALPGAPVRQRLRAVRATHPQPGLRTLSLADHRRHLLRSRTSGSRPGCRCGLYAAIEGTLDSLSGYLSDNAHDRDPPIYAEVACTGRVFIDSRGVRAQRIEILRLATSASLWPDPGPQAQAVVELSQRYSVEVCGLGVVPPWVVANVMPQGAPPEDAAIDLDALLGTLGLRSPRSR